MRVRNIFTHPVDDILPGKEGEVCDTLSTRALLDGKVLEALEQLPAEPPPKQRRTVDVYSGKPVERERRAPTVEEAQSMADEIRARGKRIAELEVLLRERDDQIAELEKLLRERSDRMVALEEEVAELKSKGKGRKSDEKG